MCTRSPGFQELHQNKCHAFSIVSLIVKGDEEEVAERGLRKDLSAGQGLIKRV